MPRFIYIFNLPIPPRPFTLPRAELIYCVLCRIFLFTATCTTWLTTPEYFPTSIRTTSHGYANACTRIGAFLTPWIVFGDSEYFPGSFGKEVYNGLALGGAMTMASVCALGTVETKGIMKEDVEENENDFMSIDEKVVLDK